MTFLELQNRVMMRLNWTSAENRELVKFFLNERYREVQAGLGLAPTRRTTLDVPTVAGNSMVTFEAAKVLTVFDPTHLKRPLTETTVNELRNIDAAAQVVGPPTHYAVYSHENDVVSLLLYPQPTGVSTLKVDALAAGVELDLDADEPTIPTDFHDLLIHGALADGYLKIENEKFANRQETKFEKRLSELRFFLVKSARLHRRSQDRYVGVPGRRVWPYSNLMS